MSTKLAIGLGRLSHGKRRKEPIKGHQQGKQTEEVKSLMVNTVE